MEDVINSLFFFLNWDIWFAIILSFSAFDNDLISLDDFGVTVVSIIPTNRAIILWNLRLFFRVLTNLKDQCSVGKLVLWLFPPSIVAFCSKSLLWLKSMTVSWHHAIIPLYEKWTLFGIHLLCNAWFTSKLLGGENFARCFRLLGNVFSRMILWSRVKSSVR